MNTAKFNAESNGRIQIVARHDLTETLELLKKWGFEIIQETGTMRFGTDSNAYHYANAGLPDGWTKNCTFGYNFATQILDRDRNPRMSLFHRSDPEFGDHYGISFERRFSLRPGIDEDRNMFSTEFCWIKDQKTGKKIEIAHTISMGDYISLITERLWDEVIAERFKTNTELEMAALWDNDGISLTEEDAREMLDAALEKLATYNATQEEARQFVETAYQNRNEP